MKRNIGTGDDRWKALAAMGVLRRSLKLGTPRPVEVGEPPEGLADFVGVVAGAADDFRVEARGFGEEGCVGNPL